MPLSRLYTDHAEVYDAAYGWDVTDEMAWVVARLGGDRVRRVLEPACGTGRILEALAEVGVEPVGLDLSADMLAVARARVGARAQLVQADMTDFRLDEPADGAVCPVNSLAHLTPDQVADHLEAVARNLRGNAHYLVQLDVYGPDDPEHRGSVSWESERGGVRIAATWEVVEIDEERGVELHRSTFQLLDGPDAGAVVEETHEMTTWLLPRWREVIAASPFRYAAVWDPDDRRRRPVGTTGELLWHDLRRVGPSA